MAIIITIYMVLIILYCIYYINGLNVDNNSIQNSNNDLIIKYMRNIDLNNTNMDDHSNMDDWAIQLNQKLTCLRRRYGQIYLYHVRKAAGTTLKQILQISSWTYGGNSLIFTEGKTLDLQILNQNGLLTVISLRDPIERIVSLYWYEHASFFITRNQSKLVKMNDWFDAWSDNNSTWKTNYIKRNPGNVYVEVDNYYTKILSGWIGPEPINEKDYEIAISSLHKIDVILISEWMNSITQIEVIDILFPSGKRDTNNIHNVVSDRKIRDYYQYLVQNWNDLKEKMVKINNYDIKLYNYALLLTAKRFMKIRNIVFKSTPAFINNKSQCSISVKKHFLGVHQPKGHKGPFKKFKQN